MLNKSSSNDSSASKNNSDQATTTCKAPTGKFIPLVDRNRCEAKGDCVQVCPYDVFEIRPLTREQKKQLSLRGKLKAWAHGGLQASVLNPDACHACSLCVEACPEKAIKLVRATRNNL